MYRSLSLVQEIKRDRTLLIGRMHTVKKRLAFFKDLTIKTLQANKIISLVVFVWPHRFSTFSFVNWKDRIFFFLRKEKKKKWGARAKWRDHTGAKQCCFDSLWRVLFSSLPGPSAYKHTNKLRFSRLENCTGFISKTGFSFLSTSLSKFHGQ